MLVLRQNDFTAYEKLLPIGVAFDPAPAYTKDVEPPHEAIAHQFHSTHDTASAVGEYLPLDLVI